MSTSKDPRDRKTYDPFGKPGDGAENGSGQGSADRDGFGYSGGSGQGGYGANGAGGGFGYTGGGSQWGGAGQNGGSRGNNGQSGSFYGPDYFSGGYANRGGYGYGYPGGGTPNAPGGGYGYQAPRRSPGYGFSLASMILGIGGLTLFWSVWVSLLCGALAVVFACVGRARDGKFSASAKAGLITGIIAVVLVIAMLICFIFFGEQILAYLEELSERLNQQYPNTSGNGSGSGTTNPGSGSGDRAQLLRLPLLWE